MAWTDTTRLLMGGASDTAYLNALKNNAEWLKDRILTGHHDGGYHTKKIDNASSVEGGYPCFVAHVVYSGGSYSISTKSGLGGADLSIAAQGTGYCTFTIPSVFASANDYAALASPISTDPERAALSSWTAQVRQSAATTVTVYLHQQGTGTSHSTALADTDFVLAIWGKHTDADSSFSTWTTLPDILDGCPVGFEWLYYLFNNLDLIRGELETEHSLVTGEHKSPRVPTALGMALYKRSIASDDRREWIIEPWSYGVPPGSFEQIQAGGASDVQVAQWRLESPGSSYGTLITPQPYSHGGVADRARFMHPMQYQDATLVAPRYYNGSAWAWDDQDSNGTGAPDGIAFLRLSAPTKASGDFLGNRLAPLTLASLGSGAQYSILLATMVREQVEELKRIFEAQHSTSDGTHNVQPPGILGVGRVVYSGGSYALQSWSTGISGVSKLTTTPNGCRLTFGTAFNSYRSWAMQITGDFGSAPVANNYLLPQVVRSSGTTADVIIHSGNPPSASYYSFNYVLYGAR